MINAFFKDYLFYLLQYKETSFSRYTRLSASNKYDDILYLKQIHCIHRPVTLSNYNTVLCTWKKCEVCVVLKKTMYAVYVPKILSKFQWDRCGIRHTNLNLPCAFSSLSKTTKKCLKNQFWLVLWFKIKRKSVPRGSFHCTSSLTLVKHVDLVVNPVEQSDF